MTNHGPADATGVTVTDTLPAEVVFVSASAGCIESGGVVTCTLGALADGGTVQVETVVTAVQGGTVINTATVIGNESDPDLGNNAVPASVFVDTSPTVAVDSDPIVIDEGQTATNTGSFFDPDTGQNITITTSTGTITQDSGASGNWSWSFQTTDGPAEGQTVIITADDGEGGVTTASFELVVNNVPPTADFTATSPLLKGGVSTLSLTNPEDPSAADVAAGFRYSFACDGLTISLAATYAAAGTAHTALCSFPTSGTFPVKGRILDKDDGFTDYDATVTVIPLQRQAFMTDSQFQTITSFDAVFTPDRASSSLKLAATNPGTYFYNQVLTNIGDSPLTATTTLTIPGSAQPELDHAFCLKGGQPIHVYADLSRTIDVTAEASLSLAQPIGGANTLSMTCVSRIDVTVIVPVGELRCLTVHLDFNGKGATGFPSDAGTTYREGFRFNETITVDGFTGSTQHVASFTGVGKRVTAIGGFAIDSNNSFKSGLKVEVYSGSTLVGDSAVTPPDGFYFVPVPAGSNYRTDLVNTTSNTVIKSTTVSSVARDEYVQVDFLNLNPADPVIEGYAFDADVRGVGGVTVELYRRDRLISTTMTSASGWYVFRFTQPGYLHRAGSAARRIHWECSGGDC